MHSDVAISVKNLTKTYRIFVHPGDRIKQALTFGRKKYHKEFTALKDVSFEIKKGETVGIIGRNGSGKSTLLQLICGILKPTSGSVTVNGRISALLELGAGFNPEFTGRENVYFQGAVMGIARQEMAKRLAEIAAFADIGEFMDQPVRIYSSGMFVRLAFAVAVHVEPDILVVDEALGVGDTLFQAKCFERINCLRKHGVSILLVTHSLEQVAHFCDAAVALNNGEVQAKGSTADTLDFYLGKLRGAAQSSTPEAFVAHPLFNPAEVRWGDGAAKIIDVALKQSGVFNPGAFVQGLDIQLTFAVEFLADIESPVYGVTIKSSTGAQLYSSNTLHLIASTSAYICRAGDTQEVRFHFRPFLDAGHYLISLGVVSNTIDGLVPHDRRYDSIHLRIVHPLKPNGEIDMAGRFELDHL
jgi:lipopolysaccharide transport system ATP-binding protein